MITFLTAGVPPDNQQFMKALYEKYKRLMYAAALHDLSAPQDCEDVLQESTARLCEKAEKLRELSEHGRYLYILATVRNTVRSLQKHQGVVERHTQPLDTEDLQQEETPAESPVLHLERYERLEALQSAWQRLPEPDRRLLFHKYFLDESGEELALTFQCRKDSLRMRLTRARRKLLKLMKEEGVYD